MNSAWHPFPKEKPTQDSRDDVFVVLSPNPHFVQKRMYYQNTPYYHSVMAFWVGDHFVNDTLQELVVDYFIKLPPIPTNTKEQF